MFAKKTSYLQFVDPELGLITCKLRPFPRTSQVNLMTNLSRKSIKVMCRPNSRQRVQQKVFSTFCNTFMANCVIFLIISTYFVG